MQWRGVRRFSTRVVCACEIVLTRLLDSCPEEGSFAIGRSTSVVRCLFCGGDRYDILRETDDGFQLGAGIACSREERPTEFEEYEFEGTAHAFLLSCTFQWDLLRSPCVCFSSCI